MISRFIANAKLLLVGAAIFLASCSGLDQPVNQINIDVGESRTATISTHCGYEWLEVDINEQTWRTTDLPLVNENRIEPDWPNGFEQTEFVFVLREPDVLEVRATSSDIAHSYSPATDAPGCA